MLDGRIAAEATEATLAIRPATLRDVRPLAELFRREAEVVVQFDPSVHLRPNADWTEYAASQLKRSHTRVLVAQYRDRLVGLIEVRGVRQEGRRSYLRVLRRWLFRPLVQQSDLMARSGTFGFIEHVYVDREVRLLGVFNKLFNEGMQWLGDQGITEVEGMIWARNEAVLNLSRRLGFESVRHLLRKRL